MPQSLGQETAADSMVLFPAGNPADNELPTVHMTGDNIWAAAGLRSAVADATLAGRPDLAAAWQLVDDKFEASLDTAINAAVSSCGHIPPIL